MNPFFPYGSNKALVYDFSEHMVGGAGVTILNTTNLYSMMSNAYNIGRIVVWNDKGYVTRLPNDKFLRFYLTDIGINAILLHRL